MAIQLGSAYGKVTLDASGIQQGVNDGLRSLKGLEKGFSQMGEKLTKIGAGLFVGVTLPIAAFFKSSIDSAMQAEIAMAHLEAVVKSTGGAAGVTADEVTKMASEFQRATRFGDEQIIMGQSMLLTFTRIGKEVFPQATEAMLNMAEKFGSIEQAAVQLGKALNDPIAGVSALRRVGVQLTQQQEEQIKQFMAVGDIVSAQKIILQELETEFGGLARAAGDTTAGKFAQLTNAVDDLKEVLGGQLIPLLLPLVEKMTRLADKMAELPPWTQKLILYFMSLAAIIPVILIALGGLANAITSLIGLGSALGGLGLSFSGISAAIAGIGPAIAGVAAAVGALISPILVPLLAILAAIVSYAALWAVVWKLNLFDIQGAWKIMVSFLKSQWAAFTAFLRGDTDEAREYLLEGWRTLIEELQERWERWFGWIIPAFNAFASFLRGALTHIRDYFVQAFGGTTWSTLGRNILVGIANGILLGIPSLLAIVKKMAEDVLAQIKKSLGIKSPSVEAMKLGAFTAQGFQMGLQKVSPESMARALVKPVLSSNSNSQQTIIQNFASGLTVQQARSMISENNEQLMSAMINALGGA